MSNIEKKTTNVNFSCSISDVLENKLHYGHRINQRHPRIRNFLIGQTKTIDIFNPKIVKSRIEMAAQEIFKSVVRNKRIFFVIDSENDRKLQTEAVVSAAKKCNQFYVTKWSGGMLTNWRITIRSLKTLASYDKRIKEMESKNEDEITFTKKELLRLKTKRDKIHNKLSGIAGINGLPDIMIVFNTKKCLTAIKEARKLGVKIIGIADSNIDPSLLDIAIPCNDDSIKSISYLANIFSDIILDVQNNIGPTKSVKSKNETASVEKKPQVKKKKSI